MTVTARRALIERAKEVIEHKAAPALITVALVSDLASQLEAADQEIQRLTSELEVRKIKTE